MRTDIKEGDLVKADPDTPIARRWIRQQQQNAASFAKSDDIIAARHGKKSQAQIKKLIGIAIKYKRWGGNFTVTSVTRGAANFITGKGKGSLPACFLVKVEETESNQS